MPFWALVYWIRVRHAWDARCVWITAQDWLSSQAVSEHPKAHLTHSALLSFNKLGWDIPLVHLAGHLHSLDLGDFLSTNLVHWRYR
jgi:hypothetical protein